MMPFTSGNRRKNTTTTSPRNSTKLSSLSTRFLILGTALLTVVLFKLKGAPLTATTTSQLDHKKIKGENFAMSSPNYFKNKKEKGELTKHKSSSANAVVSNTSGSTGDGDIVIKSFRATGKVQRVMFRQTLVRAMQKRDLIGGATNRRKPYRNQVDFTIQGSSDAINDLIERFLDSSKPINDRHAQAETIIELSHIIPINEHTVTTDNVDKFKWQPCEMYI